MSLQDRSLIFRAVLEAYSNDFSDSGKHSPRFIQQAVMDEATKPGLKADPRLTSTALGAVAVSIGKQLMTHEGLAKNFVDVELGGLGVVATFLKDAKFDIVVENLSPVGQVAKIAKPGDVLGEGIVSDVLILAVDPTPAVMEAAVAAFKETLTEGRLDEKWWNTAIQRIKGAYKALATPTHHIVTTKLNPEASASDITSLHAKARSIGGGSYLHSANPDDAAPEAMRRAKEGEVIHAFHNATDAKTFAAHAKSQGHSPKVGGAVKANPNTKVESKEDTVPAFTEAQADEIAGPLSLIAEEVAFSHELVVHKSAVPHEVLVKHLQSWNAASPQRAGIAKARGPGGTRVLFKSDKHANMFKHTLAGRHEDPDSALEGMHVKPVNESVIAAAKALESQKVTVRVTTLAQHPGATNTHFVAERLSASKGQVVSEGVKDYIFASSKAADTFLGEAKTIMGGPRFAKVEIVNTDFPVPAIKESAPVVEAAEVAPVAEAGDKAARMEKAIASAHAQIKNGTERQDALIDAGRFHGVDSDELGNEMLNRKIIEAEQVDEANLGSYTSKDGRLKYTISHKPETKEYVAKAYVDGKHHEGKTGYEGYAAGDKEDKKNALDAAHGTAKKNIETYEKTSIKESEIEESEVKSPEHHQKRIEHIKGLIADAPEEDKVRLRQHLGLEKDRLKKAKSKVTESETVDHPILRLHAHATGTIAEGRSQKEILKSMLANFALPGIPGAKNETGNVGFDASFKAAIAASKARKGILSESEYAALVDDVAFALVEHFGNEADKTLAEAVVPEFKAPLHESAGPNPATLQQIAKALLLSADVVPESLSESIQSWREHAATLTA